MVFNVEEKGASAALRSFQARTKRKVVIVWAQAANAACAMLSAASVPATVNVAMICSVGEVHAKNAARVQQGESVLPILIVVGVRHASLEGVLGDRQVNVAKMPVSHARLMVCVALVHVPLVGCALRSSWAQAPQSMVWK